MKTRREFLKVAALAPLAVTGPVAITETAQSSGIDPRAIEKAGGVRKVAQLLNSQEVLVNIDFKWEQNGHGNFNLVCTGIQLYNPNEDTNYWYSILPAVAEHLGLIPMIYHEQSRGYR